MKLTCEGLRDVQAWEKAGVLLPPYDPKALSERTRQHPLWVHFGIGNIFRIFIGSIADQLVREGAMDRGVTCVETFDYDVVDKIYTPFDNLVMAVTLNGDGTREKRVLGILGEAVKAQSADPASWVRLKEIFTDPGLQMVSFTITEKGYALRNPDGVYFGYVQADMDNGPEKVTGAMGVVTAMLYARYKAGKYPLTLVSMDNVARNGEKLRASVLETARVWAEKGHVPAEFVDYVSDEKVVAFPWTMIDKITPRPSEDIAADLMPRDHLPPHLHRALRQRRGPAVPGGGGQLPQRPPGAGEGRGVHGRPGDRQPLRAHEGHRLFKPHPHRPGAV